MSLPAFKFEVAFNATGWSDPSMAFTYVDLAADLESMVVTRGRQSEDDQAQTGTTTGVLNDDTRKYDPNNASGTYYPNVQVMKPLRVRASLPGWYKDVVNAMSPSLYWRLGEPSGGTAADASGNGHNGAYGAGCTLGVGGLLASDSDTCITCGNSTTGIVTSSFSPFVAGSKFTIMGWAKRTSTADVDILIGAGSTSMLYLLSSPATNVTFWDNTWSGVWPGTGVIVHWAITYDGANNVMELFINGVSQGVKATGAPLTGGTFTAGGSTTGSTLNWGGQLDEVAFFSRVLTEREVYNAYSMGATATLPIFYGWVDIQDGWVRAEDNAAFASVNVPANDAFDLMTNAAVQNLVAFGSPNIVAPGGQLDQETTGLRIGRALGESILHKAGMVPAYNSGWQSLDNGFATMQAGIADSTLTALQMVRDAEITEPGFFFFDGRGWAIFHDRRHRLFAPSQATFCDTKNVATGRVLFDSVTTRRSNLLNDIRATCDGGTEQAASDATSVGLNGQRTKSFSTKHLTDAEALLYAEWELSLKKDSYEVLESMTLVPGTDTATWVQVLSREVGDQITVVRTPPGVSGAGAVTQNYFIESININWGPGTEATCVWRLSTPFNQFKYWLAGVTGQSEAGTTTKAGY